MGVCVAHWLTCAGVNKSQPSLMVVGSDESQRKAD